MGTALYLFANLAIFFVMYWAWKKDAQDSNSYQDKTDYKTKREKI